MADGSYFRFEDDNKYTYSSKSMKRQDCFLQKEARVCASNAFVLEDSMFE